MPYFLDWYSKNFCAIFAVTGKVRALSFINVLGRP
uniref:Uncharacterized protein n=1 Tax=Rhizophora mucronata TaxID=61149 RepID=A0A2P2LY07_RHIMU